MKKQVTTTLVRRPRQRRRRSKLRTIVLYLQICVLLVFGVGTGVLVGTFISVSRILPDVQNYSPPEATKIFSSDDVLLATFGEENREFVKMKEIPKYLVNATVAIEDKRFYDHAGVDFKGVARAVVHNVVGGGLREGGSTITQQLARNVFLTQRKTMSRKVHEAVLAIMLERHYTKDKILELYLNQVYYGSSAFGVEAASKIYFSKNVNDLDLSECALLAGLPNRPTDLSPHVNLDAALKRRNLVLSRMLELKYITQSQYDHAKAETPTIVPLKPTKYRSKAPYFTDYVKKYLRDHYELTDDLIYRGGLRVYTTVNYKMQEVAQRALTAEIEKIRRTGNISETQGNGALVSVEPGTGYIRAMVGGADYQKSEWNRAVQMTRQPGSSFKAFVYTAAVDKLGWDAETRVNGGAYPYTSPDSGVHWNPRNWDHWYGNIPIKLALAQSVNTAAIRTTLDDRVGIRSVIQYAKKMGITTELRPFPAIAIGGGGEVRPVEMAAAYAVFASGGFYAEPTPIIKVTNSEGVLVEERKPEAKRVLPERTVKVMDECFRYVVTNGTGRAVSVVPDARGKTGTTNDMVDVWFIGYVPSKLATAVWVGNDNHTPMKSVHGSTVCGPIWREFMKASISIYDRTHHPKPKVEETKDVPPVKPIANKPRNNTKPDSETTPVDEATPTTSDGTSVGTVRVRVCDESGQVATRNCPSWHTETFADGSQPTEVCTAHGSSHKNPSPSGGQPTDNGSDQLRLTPPPPIEPDH